MEPLLATEAAGLQNQARLGALRAMANAREELIADAFAQAQDCLSQIRESQQYAAIFRAMAHEVVQALGDQDIIVRVDPRDEAIARKIFSEFNVHAEIETQEILLGGLYVTTRDGRIEIVNTLAARLEKARKIMRGPVARILTEAETDERWTMATSMPTLA